MMDFILTFFDWFFGLFDSLFFIAGAIGFVLWAKNGFKFKYFEKMHEGFQLPTTMIVGLVVGLGIPAIIFALIYFFSPESLK